MIFLINFFFVFMFNKEVGKSRKTSGKLGGWVYLYDPGQVINPS